MSNSKLTNRKINKIIKKLHKYKEYFITLANFVYINMMGFDYGRELEVPPGHELISGDVLPGGIDSVDHNRKIFEDYIKSINNRDNQYKY